MAEFDLIMMSLVIFLPTVFALGLLFFPRGSEEWMRWWSLLGTAVTLVVSLCVFVDYTKMLDKWPDSTGRPKRETSLLARHDAAVGLSYAKDRTKGNIREGDDWLSRYPWISRFNIDY